MPNALPILLVLGNLTIVTRKRPEERSICLKGSTKLYLILVLCVFDIQMYVSIGKIEHRAIKLKPSLYSFIS